MQELRHLGVGCHIGGVFMGATIYVDDVLLLVQTIQTPSGALWDNGSTCSLISHAAAKRLKLVGAPMSISIKTVTGWVTIDSAACNLTLIDT